MKRKPSKKASPKASEEQKAEPGAAIPIGGERHWWQRKKPVSGAQKEKAETKKAKPAAEEGENAQGKGKREKQSWWVRRKRRKKENAQQEPIQVSLARMAKRKKQAAKKRTPLQVRRILGDFLMKAGHTIDPEKLKKIVFYITLSIISLLTLFTLVIAAASGKSALGLILFYAGLWTAVYFFVYLFIWMTIYVYLDIRIFHRTKELEEVLPDFLQLASANISAGMPIDRALWFAVRPNFGVLAKEIEGVAKATLAGEELTESLPKFAAKYDSLVLKRSINILLEGLAAGGEIADLLNKIALNIQETKIQQKEMSANVTTYAIFITFASIVMAPLLFALATELLRIIVTITSNLDIGNSASNFLTLNISSTPKMVDDFKIFCLMMLSISALMSGAIVSVIRRGRVKEGLRNLPLFLIVSITIYFIARWGLHILLGELI